MESEHRDTDVGPDYTQEETFTVLIYRFLSLVPILPLSSFCKSVLQHFCIYLSCIPTDIIYKAYSLLYHLI